MGTSKSNPGAGGRSPLIPPWADDGSPPPPPPPPNRFQAFRVALGKAAKTGSSVYAKAALQNYAKHATGGGNTAARRFGPMAKDGAHLIGVLSQLRSGTPTSVNGIDLGNLDGLSCDAAIDALVTALSQGHGDSEKVRNAMQEALADALDGVATFDSSQFTDDLLIQILQNYLSSCVFLDLVANGADALSKSASSKEAIDFENMLLETVKAAVDVAMQAHLSDGVSLRQLSTSDLTLLQQQAIRDVWSAWEEEAL
jgi:hypothetical protein